MFLYRIIEENNLQLTFPNIKVVLRIYLVLKSNYSGQWATTIFYNEVIKKPTTNFDDTQTTFRPCTVKY